MQTYIPDAKTALKNLFDIRWTELGTLSYEETKEDLFTRSYVYQNNGKKILIGHGNATTKADAQELASNNALNFLTKQGIFKRFLDEEKQSAIDALGFQVFS